MLFASLHATDVRVFGRRLSIATWSELSGRTTSAMPITETAQHASSASSSLVPVAITTVAEASAFAASASVSCSPSCSRTCMQCSSLPPLIPPFLIPCLAFLLLILHLLDSFLQRPHSHFIFSQPVPQLILLLRCLCERLLRRLELEVQLFASGALAAVSDLSLQQTLEVAVGRLDDPRELLKSCRHVWCLVIPDPSVAPAIVQQGLQLVRKLLLLLLQLPLDRRHRRELELPHFFAVPAADRGVSSEGEEQLGGLIQVLT
eukprot:763337-Hanusia_phi.AAC.2